MCPRQYATNHIWLLLITGYVILKTSEQHTTSCLHEWICKGLLQGTKSVWWCVGFFLVHHVQRRVACRAVGVVQQVLCHWSIFLVYPSLYRGITVYIKCHHLTHLHSWWILPLLCQADHSLDFFFCSLGMDLFKWRRPASHPVLSTAPTLQLKFFSLTHSITPDTIDLTYWCVGAWLFRGIWPQLIEQAFRWWSGLSLQPKRASVQLKPSW